MSEDALFAELAAALPDVPRWVAPRGLLLARRCEVLLGPEGRRGAGYLVLERDAGEAFAVHRPVASLARQLADRPGSTGSVLAALEDAEPWRALLPGWSQQAAVIHVHPSPAELPRPRHPTRFLTLADVAALADLPAALAEELGLALARGPVAAAFTAEVPAAFAYAAYSTESWFDRSIDTRPEHRRRGYATSAAAHLIHHLLAQGKRPVWGALDADLASMAMAKKYGFRAVDRMVVFQPPRAAAAADRDQ
jgi:GNAT superfamily N-acetyltransferase